MEQQDKKISQMTQLTNISGDESVPVVRSGGNYRVLVNQIVALARQTMVAAETGKGLSANDFTDAFKAKLEGLSNYDDTQVRSLITAINGRLDTILGDGASSAIDTFNEIEAFLTGITDTQTLTGLLQEQKQTITSETDTKLSGKVDKVAGKGLSANDYSDDEKTKLSALPTKAELDSSLGAKLDKSKWDEEHGQFTVVDKYINIEGRLSDTEGARATEFICLNYKYDIKTDAKSRADTVYVITFYDSAGKRIKGYRTQDLTYGEDGFATLPASEFPEAAAYIRLSQYQAPFNHPYTFTNGPTQEAREGAVSEAIQASKLALFIDEFNAAAGSNGKYDSANAPDPQHPFYLNTLWLTYNEAVASMAHINEIYLRGAVSMSDINIRTNMLSAKTTPSGWGTGFVILGSVCLRNGTIEVLNVGNIALDRVDDMGLFAYGCGNLHTIIGKISMYQTSRVSTSAFEGSPKLQEVRLYSLKTSITFKDCPLLSLASLQCIVTNALNTSAITVTVHPTVYAKLTDATNAEWYAVTEAAAAKNIAFATTN